MAGLRHPSKGKLLLNNLEPYVKREEVLRMISFSFEKPRFNISVRVKDIIDITKNICKDHDEFLSIIKKLGINKLSSRRLYELSSGQSQLISLVLSLFCNIESIAILDEPLAHIDINYQGLFLDLISSRKNVIFTTHVLEEAEVIADKIIVLDNGKIKWIGNTEKMYSEELYEIIVPRKNLQKVKRFVEGKNGEILADFGIYILVKNISEKELYSLFVEKNIIGYRKAGLRVKVYGQI